jgi:hypothetical protein
MPRRGRRGQGNAGQPMRPSAPLRACAVGTDAPCTRRDRRRLTTQFSGPQQAGPLDRFVSPSARAIGPATDRNSDGPTTTGRTTAGPSSMPRRPSLRKGAGPRDRGPHDTRRDAASRRHRAGSASHPSETGRRANDQIQRPAAGPLECFVSRPAMPRRCSHRLRLCHSAPG